MIYIHDLSQETSSTDNTITRVVYKVSSREFFPDDLIKRYGQQYNFRSQGTALFRDREISYLIKEIPCVISYLPKLQIRICFLLR